MTEAKTVMTDKMTPIGLPLDPEPVDGMVNGSAVTEVKFWRKLGSLLEAAMYTLYEVPGVKLVKL